MIGTGSGRLSGSEIHGFHTLQDLDVPLIMEEAKTRWLRPNEIHAILSNYKYFTINAKPVNLPEGGRIIFYDRKMLRNFRKDGHNWKKKKDGKTVKEAHEHLKVGDEERIHVYYAHGEDSPTFVRRCYWLLDKTLEHIVLVHYRETQELQGSPEAPVNSGFCSSTHLSAAWPITEVSNSTEPGSCVNVINHEKRLHEINTLEWDDLLTSSNISTSTAAKVENVSYANQQQQFTANSSIRDANTCDLSAEASSHGSATVPSYHSNNYLPVLQSVSSQPTGYGLDPDFQKRDSNSTFVSESIDIFVNDGPKSDDTFGIWLNSAIADSPVEVDDPALQVVVPDGQDSYGFPAKSLQSFMPEQIFNITDVSHAWAYSTEKTKILITGYFQEGYQHLEKSNLFCICGDSCIPAEILHIGVYRCFLSPHPPGVVSLYLSCDGQIPISHVFNFEYRAALLKEPAVSPEEKSTLEHFQFQVRLAHLLFSSKNLNVFANKASPRSLLAAKKFAEKTSRLSSTWTYLMKSVMENEISFEQAKDNFLEITLKNRLKEWLMEKMLEECKTTEYDNKGQGVIHLCAILGYTWSVHMFSCSDFSLNFRDKFGWTALHWAAYYGREKMVAALLSAGARPNLVTDPTKQHPGGRTAADLALEMGYEGLAAYLSEKSLVAQFKDMKIAGNIRGTLQTNTNDEVDPQNLTEDEQNLKESLAAYRTAAEAAARIQEAFREHSLKVQAQAITFASPEEEAKKIIAALKIQHAFRKHETHKRMAAAARIQQRFHTWKLRKEFLNMRRQTIRIQAAFRAFQARKQYRKIVWSVGVLEKAIFRWRLKRKGIRGVQVHHCEEAEAQSQESDTEEAFYKTSQKQAEERYDRAVVTVQSMFRSKKAQLEYRRMKFVHKQALVEYDCLQELDAGMEI